MSRPASPAARPTANPAAGDSLRDSAVAFYAKAMAIRYNKSNTGGFLFRLAKMEHLDNQRDSEKNRSAIRKLSARNAQIRGLFGSPPKAGDFFSDTRS